MGLAEYIVMWSMEGITDPTGVVGGMKLNGTIISSEKNKSNFHSARDFEGFFPGVSFPIPYSNTSNIGIFRDDLPSPVLANIEGDSHIMTSLSLTLGEFSLSGPSYIRFGNLHMESMSNECGFDISAGANYNGSISLQPGDNGGYSSNFIQYIIDKYKLK